MMSVIGPGREHVTTDNSLSRRLHVRYYYDRGDYATVDVKDFYAESRLRRCRTRAWETTMTPDTSSCLVWCHRLSSSLRNAACVQLTLLLLSVHCTLHAVQKLCDLNLTENTSHQQLTWHTCGSRCSFDPTVNLRYISRTSFKGHPDLDLNLFRSHFRPFVCYALQLWIITGLLQNL